MRPYLDINTATVIIKRIQASTHPLWATLDEHPVIVNPLPQNAFRITSARMAKDPQNSTAYRKCQEAGCEMTLHHKNETESYFQAIATYDTMLHHIIRPQHLVIPLSKEQNQKPQ